MTSRVLRAAAIAALLVAAVARAQEDDRGWQVDASIPVDYFGGHTTYEISASDGSSSVRSQLQFPLQGVLAGLRLQVAAPRIDTGGRFLFDLSVAHSLTDASGTMKDSDWLDGPVEIQEVGAPHAGKDIFSTSRANLAALVLEGRASYQVPVSPTVRFLPALGVLYQRFSYGVYDVNQVGYGPWNTPSYTGSVPGKGLTYEVSWMAPYVGGRGELAFGPVTTALDAWFSPIATGKDEDDHLLRSKRSTTDASGLAWQVRGEGGTRSGTGTPCRSTPASSASRRRGRRPRPSTPARTRGRPAPSARSSTHCAGRSAWPGPTGCRPLTPPARARSTGARRATTARA